MRSSLRTLRPILLAAWTTAIALPVASPVQAQEPEAVRLVGTWEGAMGTPEHLFAFSFVLRQEAGRWTGTFSIPAEGAIGLPLAGVTIKGDSLLLVLHPSGAITFSGLLAGDTIAGVFRNQSASLPATLARPGSATAERLAHALREAVEHTRRSTLAETARGPAYGRVDAAALESLIAAARDAHSDALVVLHDGELVGAWHSEGKSQPIEAMSVTKSIVNLAIGRLVTLGVLESIDVPVSRFYPEWSTGRKARVTIRHILNHTSGIQADRSAQEVYASDDFVRLALDAEITSEPGSRWFYNNKAVNLLAGIVEKAAGKKMDDFLRDDLFARLGITDFGWSRAPAGNPHAMAGFQIHPMDLAKLGQLVLDRGRWQGEQLIAESWFDESLRPGSPHEPSSGLLWWLIPTYTAFVIDDAKIQELREAGVDSAFVAALARVRGRYESPDSFFAALAGVLGEDWRSVVGSTLGPRGVAPARIERGPIIGYRAEGYLGQYIVIFPEKRLVAVRMIEGSPSYNPQTDGFPNFSDLVQALVP